MDGALRSLRFKRYSTERVAHRSANRFRHSVSPLDRSAVRYALLGSGLSTAGVAYAARAARILSACIAFIRNRISDSFLRSPGYGIVAAGRARTMGYDRANGK